MEACRLSKLMRMTRLGLWFLLLAAMTGCQSGWRYDWGTYEASVAAMYVSPSDQPGYGEHIQRLQEEIRQSKARAKANEPSRIPPGKLAHLGYLYALAGDRQQAVACFAEEKQLYPESAHFIDGLMEKMR